MSRGWGVEEWEYALVSNGENKAPNKTPDNMLRDHSQIVFPFPFIITSKKKSAMSSFCFLLTFYNSHCKSRGVIS